MEPNSSSAPFHNSRVRVPTISPTTPSQTHNFLLTQLLFFLFFFTATASATLPSDFRPLYSQHCNDIVPNSDTSHSNSLLANIDSGYFTGGDRLFSQTPNRTGLNFKKGVSFKAYYVGSIIRGTLHLKDRSAPAISLHFDLNGYYSDSAKKLCMVGTGSPIFSGSSKFLVVLKLNYPKNSSVYDSLVTGTLESIADKNYFEPISILGLSQKSGYQPTFIGKGRLNGSLIGYDGGESLALDSLSVSSRGFCTLLSYGLSRNALEYGTDCWGVSCSPLGGDVGYVPTFFVFRRTWCENGKFQMLLGFPDSKLHVFGRFPFEPRTTFIAEGRWIEKENRVLAVACRILNFTESLSNAVVGDCSTRLSFRFPARLSLRNMSSIVGQIWSNRTVNDSGYFGKIGFHSVSGRLMSILDYKYEFTVYDTLRKTCDEKKSGGGKGKKYPDEHSSDMRLGMTVKNSKGQTEWGYASPLYVDGHRIHVGFWDKLLKKSHSSVVNISYELHFRRGFNFFGQGSLATTKLVSAEGIYDRENGNLCMIACRHVLSKGQNLIEKDMLDCGMKINLQFSPLDATNRRSVNGTIESTRRKSDPLYFEPMELSSSSITKYQAANSISRIDLENVMVLISNTLACVFVGWQLYYVKKHPGVLPFISIVMLFVLILGYMIPLLSNFGAMFVPNRSWQDKFLGTGEWLKVNEVIVSALMLVAFLLQLRLLQLTWSLRQGEGSQKGLMDNERKVLYATLPLYIAGALITWLVHQSMDTHHSSYRPFHGLLNHGNHLPIHLVRHQHTLWDDLKSYAGFVLDGFLLPQILLNLFFNSGEKALAISFYFGTTMIRLLPHAYDLYRARTYPWIHALKYIYANPGSDFYSTAWNVIIPCGGLLFAAIVFLQQKFGGRCILPKRFTDFRVNEKVSVTNSEGL